MDATTSSKPRQLLDHLKKGDLIFVAALFGTVVLLVMPVPAFALDMLLAASIGLSLLMLLIIIYVKDPPEFSGFPTLLLAITLYRLSLNVASTRLILADGHAGNIIDAFGHFVVRGNYVVGAVVFLILVVINFMVITKGAGRIAEVAARFTLDAMPGKQMAIDAELNAGIIDEATATKRRYKIQKEADFYGAMDGASKFVRGDAIAGILITLINIVGGFAIGILQKGMPILEALQKFTLLSIGDGLVSQVPALIVSVAAGILVTRASGDSNLGVHISRELTLYPRAIAVAAGMLFVFGLMPGMPVLPFLALGALAAFTARQLIKSRRREAEQTAAIDSPTSPKAKEKAAAAAAAKPVSDDFQKLIDVDVFAIELGYGLLNLAEKKNGGDLLDRVTGVRKTLARDLGLIIPLIAIRDSLELEPNEYRFLLRNKQVARGQLIANRWMAMNVTNSPVTLDGLPTVEPVFGINAIWISEEEKRNAEINGYTVVDPASVLITHLSESLKRVSHLILGRQDVQALIDHVKERNPTLVSELIPDLVNIGIIQRVLQNLLREGVPIRNLSVILECIADFAPLSKNPDDLAEQVRKRLGVYFIGDYESEPGVIKAITLDPRLEQFLVTRIQRTPHDIGLVLDPALAQHLLTELTDRMTKMSEQGLAPIIIITSELRLAFKRFFEPSLNKLVVLSFQELPAQTEIQNVSIILQPQPQRAAA
ncbi:MAG TPA: flagellar biosynthesis protein FlhA [Chthoniobacterales bacterium]|jgi:flagellar biosynthesis protein FlhA|nr:flagellar biosynthesis protein FlhA [Chthoniobacterales bacterium]